MPRPRPSSKPTAKKSAKGDNESESSSSKETRTKDDRSRKTKKLSTITEEQEEQRPNKKSKTASSKSTKEAPERKRGRPKSVSTKDKDKDKSKEENEESQKSAKRRREQLLDIKPMKMYEHERTPIPEGSNMYPTSREALLARLRGNEEAKKRPTPTSVTQQNRAIHHYTSERNAKCLVITHETLKRIVKEIIANKMSDTGVDKVTVRKKAFQTAHVGMETLISQILLGGRRVLAADGANRRVNIPKKEGYDRKKALKALKAREEKDKRNNGDLPKSMWLYGRQTLQEGHVRQAINMISDIQLAAPCSAALGSEQTINTISHTIARAQEQLQERRHKEYSKKINPNHPLVGSRAIERRKRKREQEKKEIEKFQKAQEAEHKSEVARRKKQRAKEKKLLKESE